MNSLLIAIVETLPLPLHVEHTIMTRGIIKYHLLQNSNHHQSFRKRIELVIMYRSDAHNGTLMLQCYNRRRDLQYSISAQRTYLALCKCVKNM